MTLISLGSHSSPSPRLGIEAGHWLLRLQDTEPDPESPYFSSETRNAAFLEWLTRSPQHVAVFLETYETYRRVGNVDALVAIDVPALVRQAAQESMPANRPLSIACRSHEEVNSPRSIAEYLPRSKTVRRFAAVAFTAVALLLAGGGALMVFKNISATSMSYFTSVGAQGTVRLEEGSELTLNTASRIEVTLDRHLRRVKLVSGEVLINVHHESARPFLVESDGVRIFDLGTQFDVYKHASGTRVSVVDGQVRLTCACRWLTERSPAGDQIRVSAPSAATESREINLTEGDQVNVTLEHGELTLDRRKQTAEELKRMISWKDGSLDFEDQPLTEVVEEFNRYIPQHFVIADPEIGRLHFGGFFPSPDPGKFIEELREKFSIQATTGDTENPNFIVLDRKQ
jgi:transmembrane sensor